MKNNPKPFKTYEEQIDILKNRNLTILNEDNAKNVLQKINYYNLINGYNDLFLEEADDEKNEYYKEDAVFEDIYVLYEFDRRLRKIFLEQLLVVENILQSLISYYFSEAIKDTTFENNYLVPTNFDYQSLNKTDHNKKNIKSKKIKNKNILKLISKIHNSISFAYSNNDSIVHYMNRHKFIPLWVLMNTLTFGNKSKFYSHMKESQKAKVAKFFYIEHDKLDTILKIMNIFRNKCAHEERLYNASSKDCVPIPRRFVNIFSKYFPENFTKQKQDLFGLLLSLCILLDEKNFDYLCKGIENQISYFEEKSKGISVQEIISKMGFPNKWEGIKEVKKDIEKEKNLKKKTQNNNGQCL